MHFSDIAKGIRDSEFNRRSVTTQVIHNELIKDKRFVLIGRGYLRARQPGAQPRNCSRYHYRYFEEFRNSASP